MFDRHRRPIAEQEDFQTRALEWLLEITSRLILPALERIEERQISMAKTLDDILAAQATALTKATANTNALAAIKTILDADNQALIDLRAQLAAAGQDQTKLDAVGAGMDALIAQSDTQAEAEAALANTPAG